MRQPREHGVRHCPDPELHRRPVGNASGDTVADRRARVVELERTGRGESCVHLDRIVDDVHADLGVAECVGHLRIDLREHQSAALTHGLDGGREDVDLDAERDLAVLRHRRVHDDDVRRAGRTEQPRHQGQPRRDVDQVGTLAHARADERGLERHAFSLREPRLGIECVKSIRRHRGVERRHQNVRGGEVAAHHHARVLGQTSHEAGKFGRADGAHVREAPSSTDPSG